MTTLSARYIKTPRKPHTCEWCGKPITGPHIYLYGMAESYEKPWPMRLHLSGPCCPMYLGDKKITAAIEQYLGD